MKSLAKRKGHILMKSNSYYFLIVISYVILLPACGSMNQALTEQNFNPSTIDSYGILFNVQVTPPNDNLHVSVDLSKFEAPIIIEAAISYLEKNGYKISSKYGPFVHPCVDRKTKVLINGEKIKKMGPFLVPIRIENDTEVIHAFTSLLNTSFGYLFPVPKKGNLNSIEDDLNIINEYTGEKYLIIINFSGWGKILTTEDHIYNAINPLKLFPGLSIFTAKVKTGWWTRAAIVDLETGEFLWQKISSTFDGNYRIKGYLEDKWAPFVFDFDSPKKEI